MKRHQTNQMTPLIMNTTCDSWLISHGLSSKSWRQTNTPGESLCSPVWEEQLLRRSIIVSAWISLILLRSAARLYSICSACVRGITCLSCTCANPNTALINHNSNKTWSKSKIWFKGVPKNICFSDVSYLSRFCTTGHKGGESVADLPLSVTKEIFTAHRNPNLWQRPTSSVTRLVLLI